MFNINEELKKLPSKPGVYIMKDKNDNIIYVGKAVSLKNRVTQYFRKTNKTTRIEKMVSLIDHFEYIVTDNEAEALILECNLIKKNMPKFNVLLKDDKTYPYIKIDIKSDYPNVFYTRTIKNDGAKYFGPYANPGAAKEMINFIKERFQIRQCRVFKSNKRACLNYHIKRCLAPCVNYVSKEEYRKQIDQIIMLLEGRTDAIIKELDNEIKISAEKQEYEISVCVEIFFVRNSKMIGREHYFLNNMQGEEISTILSDFVKQYYMQKEEFPSKIMLQEDIQDRKIIEHLLEKKAGKKVEFRIPQKGEKLRFIEMAINNAKITLENKTKDKQDLVLSLKQVLNLQKLPRKIECYDISNISGDYMVAGMCVAIDGTIKRNLARRFKIKTVFTQDDPRCLEEVVTRRIKHSIENPKGGFGELPNVILADGGITQIRAIKRAIDKYNVEIPVFGMVKDDKHRSKNLIDENRNIIKLTEEQMNFITRLQDEVHSVAIEYNRKLREKDTSKSELDKITGIGKKRKQELLKKFGSIEGIKKASLEELTNIKGINADLARNIKEFLD